MTVNTMDINYGMTEMSDPELAQIEGGLGPLAIAIIGGAVGSFIGGVAAGVVLYYLLC